MNFIIMGLWFLTSMLVVKGTIRDLEKERADHQMVAILKTQKVGNYNELSQHDIYKR